MMTIRVWIVAVVMSLWTASLHAGPRDGQWKEVDAAVNKGLPKTAIEKLEPIIQGAVKDQAWPEAVKAITRKISLEGNIQGNKPEERIIRLEAELAKAPVGVQPVLETLLAHWYWHYFQRNRWRFMQRTATAGAPGQDFTTWDLPRLFAEIDKHFQKALAADKMLKAIAVSDWTDLLEAGTLPDRYRPRLYDFIAHEALAFYTSGEQAAAKPQDAFELPAESPVFDSASKYLEWHRTFDAKSFPDSPVVRALDLYGKLLAFHQIDADNTAYLDADLARLIYGNNVAVGEAKKARFKAALQTFHAQWGDHEIAAKAAYELARLAQQENNLLEARTIALRASQAHPQAPAAGLCRNLVKDIESRSIRITTERVWPKTRPASPLKAEASPLTPAIAVRYKNIETVYFRAVAKEWDQVRGRRRPEYFNDEERKALLNEKPVLEWKASLTPTADYREKTRHLPAPDSLKPGYYFLLSSTRPDFNVPENQISVATVWVSDLALVVRPRASRIEGFVLEAGSGEPIRGAAVDVRHYNNNEKWLQDPGLTTDENGFFSMPTQANQEFYFRARHQDQEVATTDGLYHHDWNRRQRDPRARQTLFFMDRAIYRPGQILQFKGICLEVAREKDQYNLLPGEEVTVAFLDPNDKEVATSKHRANDQGSFSGSFTAPRDRVLGQMRIEARGSAAGTTYFRVEEYKRPKFEVALEPPKTAARLNKKVSVQGKATSYTGAAVDGAGVKYRVVREVRMPWWWWGCGWRRGGGYGNSSQEIAHGTARTGSDGSFTLEFLAKPDPAILESDEPSFVYAITADVTDSTGETRSANHSITVGYTALEARMEADPWQTGAKPMAVKVTTKTLDGEPQVAEGVVKVHALKAPARVQRVWLGRNDGGDFEFDGVMNDSADKGEQDLSNPSNWPLGEVVAEQGFTTDSNGVAKLEFKLPRGNYRAELQTQDRFGKKVTGRLPVQVLEPGDDKLGLKIPHLLAAPSWEVEPGQEFMALWGTGYEQGRAYIEIERRDQMLQSYWTQPGRTQQQVKQAVTEALRGGFFVHVTQIRENRAYLDSRKVEVPWSNKELELKWEHFTSKLQPAQKETWTLVVRPAASATNATRSVAEVVATLYDASLDAFAPNSWPHRFGVFYQDSTSCQKYFANASADFRHILGHWNSGREAVRLTYRAFPRELTQQLWGYRYSRSKAGVPGRMAMEGEYKAETAMMADAPMPASAPVSSAPVSYGFFAAAKTPAEKALSFDAVDNVAGNFAAQGGSAPPAPPKPDLSKVTARKNLNETAFFYPHLTTDSNGVVRITFAMPEALTRWRFLGFAHDAALRSGFLEGLATTSKDLMVQPNPPRFLREGDRLEFTVKVSNQSDQPQTGRVKLAFNLAQDGQSADALLGNQVAEQSFDIPARESRSFSWPITVPDGCGFLTYKAVGATDKLSDGEEGVLPVLSRRILVTESLPLPIRGPATKKFEFAKLLASGKSKTLQHRSLTVQMVSQPAWYAVLALPYLMEFPHECSEQTFNRFYANALARFIAGSDPKIRNIFDQWKNTPALDSPLEKNQDFKAVMIEETPWLRQAQNESQSRRNVGILFDENRLNSESERTLQKLAELQLEDGSWPWFPGGRGNDYITLYITTGFGRLRHLGVDVDAAPAIRSLDRLDRWMHEHYLEIQRRPYPEKYVPGATDALYLYGRSFFLKDKPVAAPQQKAVEFFLGQARKHWLNVADRQSQGHLAIALHRWGGDANVATARDILKSIKERSVTSEEMGRFWRETELSWWWYRAPIETQALMIEAFDEVMGDAAAVEECRVWLLKQKQTQDWKTTKATADAVYGLLLRGKNLLGSDKLVEVEVGGVNVTPGQSGSPKGKQAAPAVEPGTGFYEVRFSPGEIKPKQGRITVKKVDEGVSWGSVHWQYLEDMAKVTPYEGTPLKLKKALFVKENTSKGPVLSEVKGPIAVGDELVVRIELRVDRDMEYVHLKDQRGSGTEPVNVLSRYKYQDGLAYYESTRDTASHFFIDYLPKGTYVFEYSTRVQHRGQYQTGMAEIQCMYAPEFNSHSVSLPLTVK